ncbi:hypothetical protein SUNI508_11419 [Seiridium unicorne]|uniref:Major facilitator superfamily (MFS) profile domain-containing protein n=1 Tax=Seiridium unicorne TaxID=138068 RepID=A0ABR2UHF1_9PEZI
MSTDDDAHQISLSIDLGEARVARLGAGEYIPTFQQQLTIYMLGFTSLIVAVDASIIPIILATMIDDLEGDKSVAFWIGTSYHLVNAATMPFVYALSDIFGCPICFEFSLTMFSIGTLVCCTAHDVIQMLAGRCIQGIGGAGIQALGIAILCDIIPLKGRPKWYGVTFGGWAIGLSLGPIIGGGIVEHTTWRVAFYILPLYFLSVKGKSALMAGTLMLSLLLPTFLSAVTTGRLVTKYADYRLPICIGWMIACIGTGLLIAWYTNPNTIFQVFTQIILGVGTGAVLHAQNSTWQAMYNLPAKRDHAMDTQPNLEGRQIDQEARTAVIYLFSRQFGYALGVGIGGTTFQNVMALKLGWLNLPLDAARNPEAFVSILSKMTSGPQKMGIINAYTYGFMGCASVVLCVSVIALILSLLFVNQFDMKTTNDTQHVL